jgi:hypothetical protein
MTHDDLSDRDTEDLLADMATGRLNTEEVLREIMKAAGGPAEFAQEVWKLVKQQRAEQVRARVLIAVLQLMDRHTEKGDEDDDLSIEELEEEARGLLRDDGGGT